MQLSSGHENSLISSGGLDSSAVVSEQDSSVSSGGAEEPVVAWYALDIC